jgi:hypothetical protein
MNKKQLKTLIKEMVRESLTEIFVEMKLESIVENVVRQQAPIRTASAVSHEVIENPRRTIAERTVVNTQPNRTELRENLKKNLGVSDDEWRNIYSDVNMEKLPPSGAVSANENPEFVSEDDLRALGFNI